MSTDGEHAKGLASVLYEAGISGDVETVRGLLQKHGDLLDDREGMNMLLQHVSMADHVDMLALLVEEFGLDVNAPRDEQTPEGALDEAAGEGAIHAARWLLDHGARVNHQVDGRTRCFALSSAVFGGHLDLVKLLVERGADINAAWAGKNALSFAMMRGDEEITAFLRSKGAVEPGQLANAPEPTSPIDPIVQHFEQHLGKSTPLSLHEVVPGDPPMTLHAITMADRVALFTSGMSDRPMTVPPGSEAFRFAELLIYLPKGWPLTDASLGDPSLVWPIKWMMKMARFPHENGTWLGGQSAILTNNEPPEPLAPNTQMTCILATTRNSEFDWFPVPDGRCIVLYTLQPLYTEECDLERSTGVQHLLDLLEAQGISPVVDIHRPNVAPFS